MPKPARPRQRRRGKGAGSSSTVFPVILLLATAGAVAAAVLAPDGARAWVLGAVITAWCCIAVIVATASYLLRRARRQAAARDSELGVAKDNWKLQSAEVARLVSVSLPGVARDVKNRAGADEALTRVVEPSDPQLRQVLRTFAEELSEAVRRAAEAEAELQRIRDELTQGRTELQRLTDETLPAAVALLRDGSSANTVLTKFDWPQSPALHRAAESFVRELAYSERRSAAAQAASAKALSRVQAKTVAMLADLRAMQERHREDVLGDLLQLDHSTSQLGLMTDRLALLMGGRSSRVWNKPIVMESILRGSVGRIAAYRRVRLHSSSRTAIAGFASEGVMHLLAELMDNAANFSPPIDEVHVYVEERSAGLVITIEDSGLKMSDAAMRRAQEAVSGQVTDLASLQGTRLGLAVVGRLANKYNISVNYRPSSRGGTGVVVLLPPELVAQQREPVVELSRPARDVPEAPAPIDEPEAARPTPTPSITSDHVTAASGAEIPRSRDSATENGLPVRAPGRTMAAAEEARRKPAPTTPSAEPREQRPARDVGKQFGAFHRARHAGDPLGDSAAPDDDEHRTTSD